MKIEKITQNGTYIHTGFSIAKMPVTIVKDGKEELAENGKAYIYFVKDGVNYYVVNDEIKDSSNDLSYGVFQPFMNPTYIYKDFHISVENGVVDIVEINVLSAINEDEIKDNNGE